MKPSDAPTVKAKRSPIVLVVGFPAAFVRRCNDAALKGQATVVGVEAGAESSFATQTLPIAVVMHTSAVPASPLGKIARELGIELVTLDDEDVPDPRLEELILGAITASQTRKRGS